MGDWNYNHNQGTPWPRFFDASNEYYHQNYPMQQNMQSGFQEYSNRYQNIPNNYRQPQNNTSVPRQFMMTGDPVGYNQSYGFPTMNSVQNIINAMNNLDFELHSDPIIGNGLTNNALNTAMNLDLNSFSHNYGDKQPKLQNNKPNSEPLYARKSNASVNSKVINSNLVATAEEFVPSYSQGPAKIEKNDDDERKNPSTSKVINQQKNDTKNKPKGSSDSNFKENTLNTDKKILSWRQRDDDDDDEFEYNAQSVVFEHNKYDKNIQNRFMPNFQNRNDSKFFKKDQKTNRYGDYAQLDDNRGYKYNAINKYVGFENKRDELSNTEKSFRNSRNHNYNTDSEVNNGKYRDYDGSTSYHNNNKFLNRKFQNYSENSNSDVDNGKYNRKQKNFSSNDMFKQKGKRDDYFLDRENDPYNSNYSGAVKKSKNFQLQPFKKNNSPILSKDFDGANVTQRERLTEQLNKGILECLVCCEHIKQFDSVWSCGNCFHVLHLDCIKKWANSSIADGKWRCPACQNSNYTVPHEYLCFCGKNTNPDWVRGGDSAHTCGNICGRLPTGCFKHPCTLLCHAGPCPQCDVIVLKKCECGATEQSMKCSYSLPLLCKEICKKNLNCKIHKCEDKCHAGPCQPCKLFVDQQCFCSNALKRTLPCDSDTAGINNFSCGEICNRKLSCNNHNCVEICHQNQCKSCKLLPENVKVCPCGQTLLSPDQLRTSCLDPIPLCEKICSKKFTCGPVGNEHVCKIVCHSDDCLPCPDKTQVACRCGNISKDILCINLEKEKDNVRCRKKCSKKQSCGRHRCKILCCIDTEHRCPLPCNRMLNCGLHRCEETCHSGHCEFCWRTSFDELHCRCGESVRYPPIPCGTRPPSCSQPCSIPRPCGHPPLHNCHPDTSLCTPCAVLTQRYCHGRHKMRKTIPCHQEEFSCGLPCNKDLSCGKHKCIETCHKGSCPTVCTQQCEVERYGCGHPCGASCGHPAPCPVNIPCKRSVNVTCSCGRRTAVKICADHMKDIQRLQVSAGLLEGAMGKPVDIKALIAKGNTTVTLDCDDECYVEERNRRMAIGLQIRNPDISSKLTPRYSDFMKQFLTRDESFCVKIHDKLTELVLLAQKSVQKTRSHSFQPMNHLKRQFVHEYCEHFGCDSKAYDTEPYRNIVATAYREKSWLPALSLMEVVRRDKGQRRVPGPVVGSASNANSSSQQKPSSGSKAWSTLSTNYASVTSDTAKTKLTSTTSLGVEPGVGPDPARRPKIDYFDAPPED